MGAVTVLHKGQIVIPASIRKKYAIMPGNKLQIIEYGRLIYLIPSCDDPVGKAMGCLPPNPSLSEELLADRKKDDAI